MTARAATKALAAGALLASALLFTGCTPAPEPTSSLAPSSSPPPTATPPAASPAPSPTEAPTREAESATCDTVLTPEATAALAEQGLDLREGATQGYPLAAQFAAAGGIACTWAKPQSDVFFTVVQLPVAEGEHVAWDRVLAENGYTPTDDPVPGTHTGPVEPGTGIAPIVIDEGSRLTFMSAPAHATDLAPLR